LAWLSIVVLGTGLVWGQTASLFEKGLTLHKKSTASGTMGQEAVSNNSTLFFNEDSIREKSSSGEEFIIFYKEERLVAIDHNRRSYSETTFQELQERLDRVSRDLAEKAEENRNTMEMTRQLLGNRLGEIRLERQGSGEEIAGFATERYLLSMPPVEMIIWAAPELAVPDLYYDMLKLHAVPNPLFDMRRMFEAVKQIDGLSLKTVVKVKVMSVERETTEEVYEVNVGPVPEPVIPSEYQKITVTF
jgi:hypothetical protein